MEDTIATFVKTQSEAIKRERANLAKRTQVLQNDSSPAFLQKIGLALVGLRITKISSKHGKRTIVTLEAPVSGDALHPVSLRGGDIVRIEAARSKKSKKLAHQTELIDGVLISVTQKIVTVAISPDDTVPNEWNKRCTIRQEVTDVTYLRILRALDMLKIRKTRPYLHQVIFDHQPARKTNVAVKFLNPNLNESQKEAVRACVGAQDISLVHGPPGTGKTHTVVEIVRQLCSRKMKVLVCAPSNVAVDNLTERLGSAGGLEIVRLGHPARILPNAAPYSLENKLYATKAGKIMRSISFQINKATKNMRRALPDERKVLLERIAELKREVRGYEKQAFKDIYKKSNAVLSTLSGAGSMHLVDKQFDVVVIDEATQASEAECWIAALKAPRLILAGDHHQLPPMASLPTTPIDTLFNQVRTRMPETCNMLTTQYRMNKDIAKVSSDVLYEGRLHPDASVAEHLLSDLDHVSKTDDTECALILIDTTGSSMPETKNRNAPRLEARSKCNPGEADLAVKHIRQLVSAGVRPSEIAVISPYKAQVRLLEQLLQDTYPAMEIGTVDGFQGREKEAVVLSLVCSNESQSVGFLRDYRRINVAITRARRQVCIIADASTVSHGSDFLRALFAHIEGTADILTPEQVDELELVEGMASISL